MAAADAGKLRVLALLFGQSPDELLGTEHSELGPLHELAGSTELHTLRSPSLEELPAAVAEHLPTLVYIYGGTQGSAAELGTASLALPACLQGEDGALSEAAAQRLLQALSGPSLQSWVLDFAGSAAVAQLLTRAGGDGAAAPRHVVAWEAEPPALAAWDWAHCFLGLLCGPGATLPEAYALACHMAKAHGIEVAAGIPTQPPTPQLLTASEDGGSAGGSPEAQASGGSAAPALTAQPASSLLPGQASVPAPQIEGADLSAGLAAAFPGYAELRLLAPNAELRLLQAGLSAQANPHNLRFFGEALRALLVLETRDLQVLALTPLDRPPPHLPAGTGAVRAEVRTPAGARCAVTLGGPSELLKNEALVQHALRQAMTADARTLQLKLTPPGCAPPPTHVSPGVAAGAPVVEGLAVTSVWTVQLLKLLAQDASYRSLVLLGVAAVSTSPVAAFGAADAARYLAVLTHNDPAKLHPQQQPEPAAAAPVAAVRAPSPPAHASAAARAPGAAAAAAAAAAAGSMHAAAAALPAGAAAPSASPSPSPSNEPAKPAPQPWESERPPLAACSEQQFLSDLIAFLEERQGRSVDVRTFPEAVLNGSQLDLFALYREVVTRGGFKVGNGINWKARGEGGQVFPRMRNFTATHRMTGVGNALKRHYQALLLDYEQARRWVAHPGDITGDRCGMCGRGDDAGSDWVCCEACQRWVHFSCDTNQTHGSFKDFSRGSGRVYHCPRCAEVQRQQQAQAQAAQAQQQAQQEAADAQLLQLLQQQPPAPPPQPQQPAEGDGPEPMQE